MTTITLEARLNLPVTCTVSLIELSSAVVTFWSERHPDASLRTMAARDGIKIRSEDWSLRMNRLRLSRGPVLTLDLTTAGDETARQACLAELAALLKLLAERLDLTGIHTVSGDRRDSPDDDTAALAIRFVVVEDDDTAPETTLDPPEPANIPAPPRVPRDPVQDASDASATQSLRDSFCDDAPAPGSQTPRGLSTQAALYALTFLAPLMSAPLLAHAAQWGERRRLAAVGLGLASLVFGVQVSGILDAMPW